MIFPFLGLIGSLLVSLKDIIASFELSYGEALLFF